jgi:hypothetical protein
MAVGWSSLPMVDGEELEYWPTCHELRANNSRVSRDGEEESRV